MQSARRIVLMFGMLLTGCGDGTMSATNRNDAMPPMAPAHPSATATLAAMPGVSPHPADGKPGVSPHPADGKTALPAVVAAFRNRRDQCDHFRGEEAGDDARAAELAAALARTCRGTDAELAGLRRRYRSDAGVMAALGDDEKQVEPGTPVAPGDDGRGDRPQTR